MDKDTQAALEKRIQDLEEAQRQQAAQDAPQEQRFKDIENYLETQFRKETRERSQREFNDLNGPLAYSFKVRGDNTPFVEMKLAPGREIVAEPGSFMFKTENVKMSMSLGDGSQKGFLGKIWGATKRKIGGESALLAHFTNSGNETETLALAAGQPGEVIALNLADAGGSITCQRGAFMAAPGGTNISVTMPKRVSTGFFSGEGFILQKITGDGHVFMNAGGNFATKILAPGQKLQIDTGCVLAMTDELAKSWRIEFDKSPLSMLFNERGMFLTTVEGPGKIWVQSMPFSRQVATMAKALDPHFKRTMSARMGNS